jgi:hypothetical protein
MTPYLKRAAAVGIVLIIVLIAWELWRMSGKSSIPVTPTTPALAPPGPAPAPKEPVIPKKILPAPAPVLKKPVITKKITPSLPSAPRAPAAQPVVPVPPVVIPPSAPPPPAPLDWQGNDTAITHPGEVVIRNDHQWIQFWAEHHPHEAAPEVDFGQSMVIGVFAGSRPADQFTIHIVDIRALADRLSVSYQEKLPPPGTFALNVTVYPYELKVIPWTTLPVKFNKLLPINPNQ